MTRLKPLRHHKAAGPTRRNGPRRRRRLWLERPRPGHGFHEIRQGLRYTISEPARRTVLTRLLQFNHERYEEEVSLGLHEKKGAKKKGSGRSAKMPGKKRPAVQKKLL